MVSRLQRRDEALDLACRHLEQHLETSIRAKGTKSREEKS
jgi:hypothetical protein